MSQKTKLEALLTKRKEQGSLRTLGRGALGMVDFSSNDYLGLARSEDLKNLVIDRYTKNKYSNGSTGSRLLTGNNELTTNCEKELARLFGFEQTTLFNSGYTANLALFSALPQRGDTIIYDEYAHVCIKDGCRLSMAHRRSFKHNDLKDLERKLGDAEGEIFIACESVYSMDGDIAPLEGIIKLANDHKAKVIVDEAHSTGVFGKHGSGLISEMGLQNKVFAVIYTFGKAMGIHGACIAGDQGLKDFITNFSRPFIYTTAPSPFEVISVQSAFEQLRIQPSLSLNLQSKIELFNSLLPEFASPSAIKSVHIGGNEKTKSVAKKLQNEGFDIRPILSPTVKEGSERLRICLHTFNTEKEISLICDLLKNT
ncbi:pyridoxal phosphate-dependent aminotransferase family protein [Roseivirga sp. E12]|uniref:aminotransferase class I/II-fold pyridoxal phosphate-dependent enzyme n=1 Tax=Roseivirga sp. E12 TaxID=2819237 RepID=UPI001ABC9136|nr:pyridoxal phosphate-dependent aminotransferase family protein [Roseivirga sp. E12]MBO3700178.1 pyridoxal phosphate-dependent aminotransferase family protein [Roseivirga sp. E12]